jgi:hypothetical protein
MSHGALDLPERDGYKRLMNNILIVVGSRSTAEG